MPTPFSFSRTRRGAIRVAAFGQTPRPLRVALLNLMPDKPTADAQWLRVLRAGAHSVSVRRIVPDNYPARSTDVRYLARHYRRFSQIRHQSFDALVVTGAPLERLPFRAVTYWSELCAIMDWASARVASSLFVCWAAQAALHHRHAVPKCVLERKLFGVYPQRVVAPHDSLVAGLAPTFFTPVSRFSTVDDTALNRVRGLHTLARSSATGPCVIADSNHRSVYMLNHLEYDALTLHTEYLRDRTREPGCIAPLNAPTPHDMEVGAASPWQRPATTFFSAWLDRVAVQAAVDSPEMAA